MRRTIGFGDDELAALAVDLDVELGVFSSQRIELLDRLIKPLPERHRDFGSGELGQ